jgi:hypothetical protein
MMLVVMWVYWMIVTVMMYDAGVDVDVLDDCHGYNV